VSAGPAPTATVATGTPLGSAPRCAGRNRVGIGMLPSTLAGAASTADSAGPQLPGWLGAVLLVAGGLVAGATVGAVQAWAARGYATGGTGWVVANAIGWTLALAWIFALAGLPCIGLAGWAIALDGFVAGVGSGTIVGLVTGAVEPPSPGDSTFARARAERHERNGGAGCRRHRRFGGGPTSAAAGRRRGSPPRLELHAVGVHRQRAGRHRDARSAGTSSRSPGRQFSARSPDRRRPPTCAFWLPCGVTRLGSDRVRQSG
jgi:hypothetical protein